MSDSHTILIADDDQALSNALRLRLEAAGYHVVTVADSYNALAKALAATPDLLILDINMPAGDGFSVQERFEALEPLRHVPVIYVTGDQSTRLDSVAKNHGAVGLFHKPFDTNQLIETVQRVLTQKAA